MELTTKAEPILGKFKELGGFCVSSSLALVFMQIPSHKYLIDSLIDWELGLPT